MSNKFMKYFKNAKPVIEEVMDALPEPKLSEGMIRRDNYFHSCWMLLKNEHPDIMHYMNRVELIIAGYDPDMVNKEDTDEKTDDEEKRITL